MSSTYPILVYYHHHDDDATSLSCQKYDIVIEDGVDDDMTIACQLFSLSDIPPDDQVLVDSQTFNIIDSISAFIHRNNNNSFHYIILYSTDACNKVLKPPKISNASSNTGFIINISLVSGVVSSSAGSSIKVPVDLNNTSHGPYVYLCYEKSNATDSFIVDLTLSYDNKKINEGCSSSSICIKPNELWLNAVWKTSTTSSSGFVIQDIITSDKSSSTTSISSPVVSVSPSIPLYAKLVNNTITIISNNNKSTLESQRALFSNQLLGILQDRTRLRNDTHAKNQAMLSSVLRRNAAHVLQYQNTELQSYALSFIPEHIKQNSNDDFERIKALTHWFKNDFFSWTDAPNCAMCTLENPSRLPYGGKPTEEDLRYQGYRVELYQCTCCQHVTRFVRYNDPKKLFTTRTGRCGEWANAFTLCCIAVGFKDSRYVYDTTDHVWTEVYINDKWIHVDPCEGCVDTPLVYSLGWKKNLSFVFSFSHTEVVDVIRRYTLDSDSGVKKRRDEFCNLQWLSSFINELNLKQNHSKLVLERQAREQIELYKSNSNNNSTIRYGGRVSGSAAWKAERQEDGKKESITTKEEEERTTTVSRSELLKLIFNQMVNGCGNSSCNNNIKYCGNGASNSSAENVAKALVTLDKLKGLYNLRVFLCDNPTSSSSIRDEILQHAEYLSCYYPLQGDLIEYTSATTSSITTEQAGLKKFRPMLVDDKEDIGITNISTKSSAAILKTMNQVLSSSDDLCTTLSFIMSVVNAEKSFKVLLLQLVRRNDNDAPPFSSWSLYYDNTSFVIKDDDNNTTTFLKCDYYCTASSSIEPLVAFQVVVTKIRTTYTLIINNDKVGEFIPISSMTSTEEKFPAAVVYLSHVAMYHHHNTIINKTDCCKKGGRALYVKRKPKISKFYGNVKNDADVRVGLPPSFVHHFQHQIIDAASFPHNFRISRVTGWEKPFSEGGFIQGICITYTSKNNNNAIVNGPRYCTFQDESAFIKKSVILKKGEVITSISGRSGFWMDTLTIKTSGNQELTIGSSTGGNPFTMFDNTNSSSSNIVFRALEVHVGDQLDKLRMVYYED